MHQHNHPVDPELTFQDMLVLNDDTRMSSIALFFLLRTFNFEFLHCSAVQSGPSECSECCYTTAMQCLKSANSLYPTQAVVCWFLRLKFVPETTVPKLMVKYSHADLLLNYSIQRLVHVNDSDCRTTVSFSSFSKRGCLL